MSAWAIGGIAVFVAICLLGMWAEGNPYDDGPNWPSTRGDR